MDRQTWINAFVSHADRSAEPVPSGWTPDMAADLYPVLGHLDPATVDAQPVAWLPNPLVELPQQRDRAKRLRLEREEWLRAFVERISYHGLRLGPEWTIDTADELYASLAHMDPKRVADAKATAVAAAARVGRSSAVGNKADAKPAGRGVGEISS